MEIDEHLMPEMADSQTLLENEQELKPGRETELEEMLMGLKRKFSSLENNDPLKLRIVTIAPPSWSINKISEEFGSTRYLAERAKQLRLSEGVLGCTTAKTRRKLSDITKKSGTIL